MFYFLQKAINTYIGFISNLAQRLLYIMNWGKDWKARYRPWKLIYTKEFDNKTEAMVYEKWLKSGTGRDFIKTIERRIHTRRSRRQFPAIAGLSGTHKPITLKGFWAFS